MTDVLESWSGYSYIQILPNSVTLSQATSYLQGANKKLKLNWIELKQITKKLVWKKKKWMKSSPEFHSHYSLLSLWQSGSCLKQADNNNNKKYFWGTIKSRETAGLFINSINELP